MDQRLIDVDKLKCFALKNLQPLFAIDNMRKERGN